MKSALSLVAFAHSTHQDGTAALLEVAFEALERDGNDRVAELIQNALILLRQAGPEEAGCASEEAVH